MPTILSASFDPVSRFPLKVTTPAGRMDVERDGLERMTAQRIHLRGDVPRRCASTVSPGGRVVAKAMVDGAQQRVDFDSVGRVARVTGDDAIVTFEYDTLSRPVSRTVERADGLSLTRRMSYDGLGRLQAIEWVTGDARHTRRMSFGRHSDGKIAWRRLDGWDGRRLREESFAYDERGRLVLHRVLHAVEGEYPRDDAGPEFTSQRFTFDAIDNLLRVETTLRDGRVDIATSRYDAVDRDRLTSVAHSLAEFPGPRQLTYDANGNLTADGLGRTVRWEAGGRLFAASPGDGVETRYETGPTGRIGIVTREGVATHLYHDDGALAYEHSAPERRRYLRVGRVAVAETRLCDALRETLLAGEDHENSVVCQSGDEVAHAVYSAYGSRHAQDDRVRTGFAGEVRDAATGCYRLGNRLYADDLKRFVCPDSSSPFGAGGFNRYAYCAGDPVNRIDPTGSAWWDVALSLAGLALSVAAAIASVGALAGSVVAAGGGLLAAVSSPSVIASAVTATIDIVSLVADAGSVIGELSGDDPMPALFGALALGGAAVGLGKLGRAGARRLAGAARRPRVSARGADGPRVRTPERLPDMHVQEHIPDDRIAYNAYGERQVPVRWTHYVRGGTRHWVADTEVSTSDIKNLMLDLSFAPGIGRGNRVHLLTGVHGSPNGANWDDDIRILGERSFYEKDVANASEYLDILGGDRPLQIRDIGGISETLMIHYMREPGDVIHDYCYSAVDWVVLQQLGIPAAPVFVARSEDLVLPLAGF